VLPPDRWVIDGRRRRRQAQRNHNDQTGLDSLPKHVAAEAGSG